MKASFKSYLDYLDDHIPRELVNDSYVQTLRTLGQTIPVFSFGTFECRLAEHDDRVDLDMSINSVLNEHKELHTWMSEPFIEEDDEWRASRERIRRICDQWLAPDFYLKAFIKILWLVFDQPISGRRGQAPWLYLHFHRTELDQQPEKKAELVMKSLDLMEGEYNAVQKDHFRNFFARIPASINLMGIGTQTSRNYEPLRLYMLVENYDEVLVFLRENQWPGDVEELDAAMAGFQKDGMSFGLCVDILDGMLLKIGLEYHFTDEIAFEEYDKFTRVLCDMGLCSEEKRKAFLSWNGSSMIKTPAEFWSWPNALYIWKQAHLNPIEIIRRSYIKMVYEPGKEMIAKAYLGFDRQV